MCAAIAYYGQFLDIQVSRNINYLLGMHHDSVNSTLLPSVCTEEYHIVSLFHGRKC